MGIGAGASDRVSDADRHSLQPNRARDRDAGHRATKTTEFHEFSKGGGSISLVTVT